LGREVFSGNNSRGVGSGGELYEIPGPAVGRVVAAVAGVVVDVVSPVQDLGWGRVAVEEWHEVPDVPH